MTVLPTRPESDAPDQNFRRDKVSADYLEQITRAVAHPLAADDARHGTANAYSNWRCRCAVCREAWRVYHAAMRTRHPEWQWARNRLARRRGAQPNKNRARRLVNPEFVRPWSATRAGGAWRMFYAVLLPSMEDLFA